MKRNNDRENRPDVIDENLSLEILEEITGGFEMEVYWKELISNAKTIKDACEMLIADTRKGYVPIGVANDLVKRIEPHFKK